MSGIGHNLPGHHTHIPTHGPAPRHRQSQRNSAQSHRSPGAAPPAHRQIRPRPAPLQRLRRVAQNSTTPSTRYSPRSTTTPTSTAPASCSNPPNTPGVRTGTATGAITCPRKYSNPNSAKNGNGNHSNPNSHRLPEPDQLRSIRRPRHLDRTRQPLSPAQPPRRNRRQKRL